MKTSELSENEKRFIRNVIGPRLHTQKIDLNVGQFNFTIDYNVMDNGDPNFMQDVIVLLVGFGSGWRGIALLQYYLARAGYRVYALSLPGCGNSSDPPPIYYQTENFSWEANLLAKFATKKLLGRHIHWVGHSMGAQSLLELAKSFPSLTQSLTFLCPAGFEERNFVELGIKFGLNGLQHYFAFRGDPVWEELSQHLPPEKSARAKGRRKQRWSEVKRLCNPYGRKEKLREVVANTPVASLWCARDSVFPYSQSTITKYCAIKKELDLYHNCTMFGAELTAEFIDKFVFNQIR